MRRSRIAFRWRFAIVLGLLDDVGMFWDFGSGAPRGASLALCGRSCWPSRNMASMMPGVVELFEARWRPHCASQAEASPRVDVDEVSQAPGENAARSFKDKNSCTKGDQTKGVSLSLSCLVRR